MYYNYLFQPSTCRRTEEEGERSCAPIPMFVSRRGLDRNSNLESDLENSLHLPTHR